MTLCDDGKCGVVIGKVVDRRALNTMRVQGFGPCIEK